MRVYTAEPWEFTLNDVNVEIAFLVPIVFVELSKGPMRSFRRSYYNFFSRFYDRFVAIHSSDAQSVVRRYLSELVPVTEGERILDICTGTGSPLPHLREKIGPSGSVVGVDFSRGMLAANRQKTKEFKNIYIVAVP